MQKIMKITYIHAKNSTKNCVTKAALFDSNMHQIVCRLGLCPTPHLWSLQRSPDPLAVFRGLLLREGRKEEGRNGTEGTGERRNGERGGGDREGPEREGKGRAPMTHWHGAPNVLIRPWANCHLLYLILDSTALYNVRVHVAYPLLASVILESSSTHIDGCAVTLSLWLNETCSETWFDSDTFSVHIHTYNATAKLTCDISRSSVL